MGHPLGQAFCQVGLAQLDCEEKHYRQAAERLRQATQVHSAWTEHRAQLWLGVALFGLGRKPAGTVALRQAADRAADLVEQAPRHYEALYAQALATLLLGDAMTARDGYQRAQAVCGAAGVRRTAAAALRTACATVGWTADAEAVAKQLCCRQ